MSDGSKELGLLPERCDKGSPSLHRSKSRTGMAFQVCQVLGTEVRHGMRLEIAPDVLHRIELRRIRGQELERDGAALQFNVLTDETGAMCAKTVPYDEQSSPDGRLQCPQELNDLRRLDRACEKAKVEAHEARPGNHRQVFPAEGVLQNRRFTFGRPGACAAGTFGQTRLVYEDDDSSLPRGDFFRAGHLFDFQRLIASSLRSRASLPGR